MELITNKIFLEHDTGNHPENKSRLLCYPAIQEKPIPNGEQYLELIHPREYLQFVKDVCGRGQSFDQDTVTSPGTWAAATAAAAAAVMASESNDFALVRPPGHHAYRMRPSGFCIFNNIAIATEYQRRQGKKVFILDFDGHWGDGTADIFLEDNDVLYTSLHQFPAFPGGGWAEEIGSGKGKGYSVNVPLPVASGDDVFFKGLDVILQAARAFDPDVVAVSAGFDAHQADPLLELNLSTKAYYRVGELLRNNFPNVFAVLEGGYNVKVLSSCIDNFLAGINGRSAIGGEQPTHSTALVQEEFERRISRLLSAHKGFKLL
ncbi:MAG: histone deacetylase family protein [Candidatus Omnitrophica bacterium]|nr:histone deacetylase family protein [Candidatus Omnitrophota bacterium]